MKLGDELRGHLRMFAYFLANRTLDLEILPGNLDYSAIFEEPSALEQVFAIWINIVELDDSGGVLNSAMANRRVAQYIRSYIDSKYVVVPPFTDSETELV